MWRKQKERLSKMQWGGNRDHYYSKSMEGLSVEGEMKVFRNSANSLLEALEEGDMRKKVAIELYCDLWEEAFAEVIQFVTVDHEYEFLEVMKDVREFLISR